MPTGLNMMKLKLFILTCLLLTVFPAKSLDLYQAKVVVVDTTEEQRLPALKKALKQVLTKLTGLHEIDVNPSDIKDIEQWVQQFTYKSEIGLVWLEASFVQQEIDNLLKKLALPIWPQPRPVILAWVINNGEVINETHQVTRMHVLKNQAEDYGIEIVFPISDLYEMRTFPLKQVETYQSADIQQLAERYTANAVLVGVIENEQQANWQLFTSSQHQTWQAQDKQLNHLLALGVKKAIDKLAPLSVQQANDNAQLINKKPLNQPELSTTVQLTITDVPNLKAYATINQYLQSHPEVQDITMKNTSSNQLLFELTVNTSLQQFVQTLQSSKMIQLQSQTENNISGRFREN
jgi:hypothetical protein